MKTTIGPPDMQTRTVPVTFQQDDQTHLRDVNACFGSDDSYDMLATEARVATVALGVAAKMRLGVLSPPIEPEPPLELDGEPA